MENLANMNKFFKTTGRHRASYRSDYVAMVFTKYSPLPVRPFFKNIKIMKHYFPPNPKKQAKRDAATKRYNDAMAAAKEAGYEIFKSLKAGSNSSYSFNKDGVKSPYGFDSPEEILFRLGFLTPQH